jgi:GNAT superfamily N-acetyltransferase
VDRRGGGDDEFRPQWSVPATLPELGDAGFVTAAVDWIVQVGVVPAARRRGVGETIVTEALRRMRADGATQAWLDVNVDNPRYGSTASSASRIADGVPAMRSAQAERC